MKKKIIGICVSMLLITIMFSTTSSHDTLIVSDTSMLIRIENHNLEINLPDDAEIVKIQPDKSIDVILSNKYLEKLTQAHIKYQIIIEDMNAYHRIMQGQYHSLAEIESMLENIAIMYPDITSLYSIGTTYEGRDIWCIEITDNPGVDEEEPGLLFTGLTHAREWPTVEICLHLLNELTSNYGSNPDITNMVNNRRIWLIACLNPDGYYYCHDLGYDWRKNRHYFPEFGTYGVDPNRNYGGSCDGNYQGSWGNILSNTLSHTPTFEGYVGPYALSENETQAIREVLINNNICAIIDWHTYGEYIVFPWAYTNTFPPDFSYMNQVAQLMAQKITKQIGSGVYTAYSQWGNQATGPSVDYTYGYCHYILGRAVFPYIVEACNEFHPAAGYLDQICAENFDGAWYLLQEAENISALLPCVLPPKINDLTTDFDGDFTVSWEEQNPIANPEFFQLDELSNHSIVIDDAELGLDLWAAEGFEISDVRFYSSNHSFKSRYREQDVSALTTVHPLFISEDMKLTFWTWYDIHETTDRGFVEISRNGRSYDIIDIFKGKSTDWIYKEYSLDDYIDESIFIRFRYTTDQGYQGEGFYVDDITPVSNYQTITTLSDSITENYYEVTGKPNGLYSYRVKGYNDEYKWGDFSTLENIEVKGFEINVSGGFGITIKIKNSADMDATDIEWKVTIDGGFVIPKQKTGTIPTIPVGNEKTIKAFIFGFGKLTITVSVTCAEDIGGRKTARGFLLLFLLGVS
jgi:hypothetical protein